MSGYLTSVDNQPKCTYLITFTLIKLACYGIIYLTANVFGIYHQILTNISQEDAFKNTIKFLNGRIQLEKEKQQQVNTK